MLPIQAAATLLRSLGTPAEQVPTDLTEATALYRSMLAERRVLVVLDNAGSVDQIRPLLPGGSGCVVIVTSRDRLSALVARDGARRLTLDVLEPDEAMSLLAEVLGADRVRTDPRAAGRLAIACGRLPLALRIAAAHLVDNPQLSISEYLAQLSKERRLAVLQIDSDERTSLRPTFDISYRTISIDAAGVFRLLGLFPGMDVTADAAAALADTTTPNAARLLDRLAAAHLVEVRVPGRYSLHDLLRLYAQERCRAVDNEADRDAALHRLLTWYLRSADAAAQRLYPHIERLPIPPFLADCSPATFDDTAAARTWLEAEQANLTAAIGHATEFGPTEFAWRLAACLRGYLWRRSHITEWRQLLHAAHTAARDAGDRYGEAFMLQGLGEILSWHDANDEAMDCFERAARLFGELGERNSEAACVFGQGAIHRVYSRHAEAVRCLEAALEVFVELGRSRHEADTRHELGVVYLESGTPEEARRSFQHALRLARRTGFTIGEPRPLRGLGLLELRYGSLRAAAEHLTRARRLAREVRDQFSEALADMLLAEVSIAQGDHSRALDVLTSCRATFRRVGDTFNEAFTLRAIGDAQRLCGRLDAADEALEEALTIWDRLGMPLWRARSLVTLGDLRADQGRLEDTRAAWQEALDVFRRIGSPDAAGVEDRMR